MIIGGIFLLLICYGKCEIIRMKLAKCHSHNSTRISLTHLAVDDESEAVYVAGTNCLYRLDKQLKSLQSVSTGPEEDSVLCSARGSCQAGAVKKPTDNFSKVLLLDSAERFLLYCGSLNQGICHRTPVNDVTSKGSSVAVPIAANDAVSTTVAFIGPGLPDAKSHRVLYVASPHTQQGPYRSQEEIPIISSRNLKTLEIIRARRFVQARIKMASQWLETFHVKYIAGFYSDGYAYFAMVQPVSAENPDEGFVSKLGRVCANDPSYESYMEITLQCQFKGNKYNLLQSVHLTDTGTHPSGSSRGEREKLLAGAFSASESNSASSKASSAICVFTMKDLQETFAKNARQCFSGSRSSRGLGFIAGANLPCPKDPRMVSDFCNEHLMIEGNIPAQSEAILTYLDDTVTALTSTHSPAKETDHLVLFLGTRRGLVRNVLLKSPHIAVEYGQTDLGKYGDVTGHVRALRPDRTGRFLYVITESEVLRMEVGQCSSYSKCDECLQSGDPFCGWCSTENRCTQRHACGHELSSSSVEHWLPFGSRQCIDFASLHPDRVSAHKQAITVQLSIRELPPVPQQAGDEAWYSCVLRSNASAEERLTVLPAAVIKNGLSCSFSPAALFKDWTAKASADHVVASLAVRSRGANRDIARRDLIVYNCGYHRRCSSCLLGGGKWNCSWCASSHGCINSDGVDQTCPHAPIAAMASCPSIAPTFSAMDSKNSDLKKPGTEIAVIGPATRTLRLPNMAAGMVSLRLANLIPTENAVFECLLETEERVTRVAATLDGTDTVICEETAYVYDAEVDQMPGLLSVIWNSHHYVDTLNVSLYKCRHKGPDCSLCMSLDSVYQCVWQNDECRYSKDEVKEKSESICPAPVVESVSPVSGPVEGGTLVEIIGRELGTGMEELKDAITVAGVPCRPVGFEISQRIVCRTDAVPQPATRSGPVIIHLPNRPAPSSAHKFYFLNASFSHLTPRAGIRSGGTRVTVSGHHLDIGSNISLTIGSVPCPVIQGSVTATRLACRMGAAPTDLTQRGAVLQIDGMKQFLDVEYLYVSDPVVTEITPATSFVSGGATLKISGENFAAVQSARLGVSRGPKDEPASWSQCEVQSPRLVLCPAPVVLVTGSELQMEVLRMHIRMEIDGWISQFEEEGREFILNYLPDPVVIPFDEAHNTRLFQGEVLLIQGKGLTSANQAMDLYVTVGGDFCNVTSILPSQIICRPAFKKAGVAEPEAVVVHIGQLALQAGYLWYPSADILVSADIVTGAAAGAGLFLLLSVAVLVFFRRRSSRAEREYKRIQTQLDTLESHVRLECRQAFAELQTDISDLASELQFTGMPYLNQSSYLMKIFFPLCQDHPVFQVIRPCRKNLCTDFEHNMQQFEQLLCREEFVISFIGALEDQRAFGIRDRANVASLLMLVLLDKLDYFTAVFARLLRDQMQRTLHSNHPQLMLRRSECILENMMSNWMALCMHDYVIDHVGQSLFLLTQAVKCQVEKGPVDCLTHQARYTLCENHLLRDHITANLVLIDVIQDDLDEKIQCRVLDCDSISQVKTKLLDALYKTTTSASTRPSLYEIDLEWHCNQSRVILNDEDSSSQCSNGWRRVNSLAHYGISESAVMTLVLRSQDHAFFQCEISPYSVSAMPSLSLGRIWHLTRKSSTGTRGSSGREVSGGGFSATGTGIPEIFLTRLISTKGTLQKYIDDLFVAMLTVDEDLPLPVKWLFDLFDQFGVENGLSMQIVHSWKNNSLPSRFWVNLIKNPELLLDINKSPSVESSLAVVAQTLMESCSWSESARPDRESPYGKLLFAKDVPQYRNMLKNYYERVRSQPEVSDAQLSHYMATVSKKYMFQMNVTNALKELFSYAVKYRVVILEKLEENGDPKNNCSLDISQTFEALTDVAAGSYFTMPSQAAHWETMSRAIYQEPEFLAGQSARVHCSTAGTHSGYSAQYEKLTMDCLNPRL